MYFACRELLCRTVCLKKTERADFAIVAEGYDG